MIILKQSHDILFYKVNEHFFDKFKSAPCSTSKSYNWRTAENGTAIFTSKMIVLASDSKTEESFIDYKSRAVLHAIIENDEKDAKQLKDILIAWHAEMIGFIKNNSLGYFEKLLGLPPETITNEKHHESIKKGLAEIKKMKPFEEKSEAEKALIERVANEFQKTKVIVHINTQQS